MKNNALRNSPYAMNELTNQGFKADIIMKWVFILRIPIILTAFFIFFYMGYLGEYMEHDTSAGINNILDEGDPAVLRNKEFENTFGSSKNIIVALQTANIYRNGFLEFYSNLSNMLENIEGVKSVYSLTTISDIYGKKDQLFVEPFINTDAMPYSSEQLRRMQGYFSSHPFLTNRIVDQEGKGVVIFVQIDTDIVKNDEQEEKLANIVRNSTVMQIEEVVKKQRIDIKPHFAGGAVVSSEISEIQQGEGYIKNVMIVVFGVVLLIIFRSFWGVILPVFVATTTIAAIMGLKTLFHSSFSTIDGLLYALIFTISIADSIHIISAWYSKEYLIIEGKKERINRIMNHVLVPCFYTTLTTAIGFGAIAISGIPQLRHFGIFATIAVIIAFILTITLIPAALTLFDFWKKGSTDKMQNRTSKIRNNFLTKFNDTVIDALSRATYNGSRIIILFFIIIGIVAVFGIFKIKIGTNPYSFLKDTTVSNTALHFIEDNICGIEDFEIILEQNGNEPFKDPKLLLEVDKFQSYLLNMDGITQGNSIIIFLKLLNRAMHNEDPAYYKIPESRELVAQYVLLYEMSGDPQDLESWVDPYYNKLRLNFKVTNQSDFVEIKKKIRSYSIKNDVPFTVSITGSADLWNKVDRVFLYGQVNSLLISISVISVILFIIFKSLKLGLFSLIVNTFPILIGFGILGYSGIGLNMGTVLIAPIAIGIAVDDTIHFLTQFKNISIAESDLSIVFNKVFGMLTKPIVFTSLILAIGFGSNTISSFKPNEYFGFVSAIALLVAMVTDLFLLPALIAFFNSTKR